jgi:hypothetical protein
MPDPLLYLKSIADAAIASVIVVLAIFALRKWLFPLAFGAPLFHLACVLGTGVGLATGYHALSLELAWPPTNGLERLLTLVLPTALFIEFIAGIPRVPRLVVCLLRISLAAIVPRVLLHGSVYLSDSSDWTAWQTRLILASCSVLLAGVWFLLLRLSSRSPGISIPSSVCLSLICTAATVMMAGYLKGGASALPLVSTLLATMIATRLAIKRFGPPSGKFPPNDFDCQAILGVGVLGLFGLLFIGRFFGEVSSSDALIVVTAPLWGWVTEARRFRNRTPWFVGLFRLTLVAIPLVVVLIGAKRDFDRDMAPLLVDATVTVTPRLERQRRKTDRLGGSEGHRQLSHRPLFRSQGRRTKSSSWPGIANPSRIAE